jgi:hypothetical protein
MESSKVSTTYRLSHISPALSRDMHFPGTCDPRSDLDRLKRSKLSTHTHTHTPRRDDFPLLFLVLHLSSSSLFRLSRVFFAFVLFCFTCILTITKERKKEIRAKDLSSSTTGICNREAQERKGKERKGLEGDICDGRGVF